MCFFFFFFLLHSRTEDEQVKFIVFGLSELLEIV